ncbi:uncharacterized protein LOC135840575 [Planococcus citri]|uniref:uncharacterized protein LOC135840575 n=1 Tax=Planococcus citri TaxID=170843 RepID=UPI0031F9EE3B
MSGLSIVEAFLKNYGFLINITIVLNVLTSCVCYIAPIISLYSRKKLIKLIKLIDTGFYTYSDEDIFQTSEYSAKDLLFKEFMVCAFVWVTYIGMTLTPLVVTLLLEDHENSVFDLLYVAWVPFGIETGQQFFFSYILQFISTIPLYTSFCSKILFTNNISIEFEYQCEKLKYALRTICQRVSNKFEMSDTISNANAYSANGSKFVFCDEDEFLRKFSECVKHYRQLQKCLDYFSEWFNLIFSCELTYGFVSFALIGYVMITGTGNTATDGKYVCLLGLFGGQLCYQCVAGEIIFTIEETIIDELYNIAWYEQTPKVKKCVQLFLNELQQQRKLRGFKIFPASIPIFASIARTSYSYLNLLSKMMHKVNN